MPMTFNEVVAKVKQDLEILYQNLSTEVESEVPISHHYDIAEAGKKYQCDSLEMLAAIADAIRELRASHAEIAIVDGPDTLIAPVSIRIDLDKGDR